MDGTVTGGDAGGEGRTVGEATRAVRLEKLMDNLLRMHVRLDGDAPMTRQQHELDYLLKKAQCKQCRMLSWRFFDKRGVTAESLKRMENKERQQVFRKVGLGMHERMCLTSFLNNLASMNAQRQALLAMCREALRSRDSSSRPLNT
eukprot:Sspe_Gene.108030::Locus_87192_Transcript_1_1_Confidence_1.000_Length_589::g.108030::m.108030